MAESESGSDGWNVPKKNFTDINFVLQAGGTSTINSSCSTLWWQNVEGINAIHASFSLDRMWTRPLPRHKKRNDLNISILLPAKDQRSIFRVLFGIHFSCSNSNNDVVRSAVMWLKNAEQSDTTTGKQVRVEGPNVSQTSEHLASLPQHWATGSESVHVRYVTQPQHSNVFFLQGDFVQSNGSSESWHECVLLSFFRNAVHFVGAGASVLAFLCTFVIHQEQAHLNLCHV